MKTVAVPESRARALDLPFVFVSHEKVSDQRANDNHRPANRAQIGEFIRSLMRVEKGLAQLCGEAEPGRMTLNEISMALRRIDALVPHVEAAMPAGEMYPEDYVRIAYLKTLERAARRFIYGSVPRNPNPSGGRRRIRVRLRRVKTRARKVA